MATAWQISTTEDITSNDSDKIFTVPANTEWQLLWIWVEYTSSATSGSRLLEIQLQSSGSNVIAQWQTGVTQNENLTYKYLFATGVPDLKTIRDSGFVMTPLMGASFLSAGQKLRIWDNVARDASADDMIVRFEYGYHTI